MTPDRNRTLSFDERKAAEAAFRALPVDPTWSESAQAIYFGILAHTQGRNVVEVVAEEALEVSAF
ncbi:MAG: hypothetical protein AB1411_05750 [Nitrospirota bacterium]